MFCCNKINDYSLFRYVRDLRKSKPTCSRSVQEPTWTVTCQLCSSDSLRAVKVNLARRPFSDTAGLGLMLQKEDLAAHHLCLWYAAGDDMVQLEEADLLDAENFSGFKMSAVRDCIASHRNRRCGFCKVKGACSECAERKCRGAMGWYHLPCGLRNNTIQVNNKTFCSEKHAKKEVEKMEKKKSTVTGLTRRPGQRKLKPVKMRRNGLDWSLSSSQPSSQSSDSPSEADRGEVESKDFIFSKVKKFFPCVIERKIYVDHDDDNVDCETEETTVDNSVGDAGANFETNGLVDAVGFDLRSERSAKEPAQHGNNAEGSSVDPCQDETAESEALETENEDVTIDNEIIPYIKGMLYLQLTSYRQDVPLVFNLYTLAFFRASIVYSGD